MVTAVKHMWQHHIDALALLYYDATCVLQSRRCFGAVFGELTSQACCPAGLSSEEAQLPSSYMATASITTSLAQTRRASCRHLFSMATWPLHVMAFS